MLSLWKIESPKRAIDIMRDPLKLPKLIGGVCAEEPNRMFVARKEVFEQACKERRWI